MSSRSQSWKRSFSSSIMPITRIGRAKRTFWEALRQIRDKIEIQSVMEITAAEELGIDIHKISAYMEKQDIPKYIKVIFNLIWV